MAVGVGVGPLIVTVALPPTPGIVAGPTAGGPDTKALTRLVGFVLRFALPDAIVVKERTATLMSPVGEVEDVCEATNVTEPVELAVAGLVKVGAEVYPAELPPEAEVNCSRALSKETVIW